tara:strand:+ start:641 stop:1597 length:957 start_codon:yes stop_codon:yes gene_type:complete
MTINTKIDNRSAFHYHRDILPFFSSIYEPILETGLFSFTGYFRIYTNNEYFLPAVDSRNFSSNRYSTAMMEYYLENMTDIGTYYADKMRRTKDTFIVPWNEKVGKEDPLMAFFAHFKITGGIDLYRRRPEYFEGIYIAPKDPNQNLNEFALENQEFLKKILEWVSKKASYVLKSHKPTFACFPNPVDISLYPEADLIQGKMQALMAQIEDSNASASRKTQANIPLTKRQMQTIFASLHGQTSKEAARILSIHPRTVDDHWRAIQIKFQQKAGAYYSRSQIIETFLEEVEKYLNDPASKNIINDIQNYRRSLKSMWNQS